MSEENAENSFSLIPYGSRELSAAATGQNRILGEMVDASLELARNASIAVERRLVRLPSVFFDLDEETAKLHKAAEQGNADAQYKFGLYFAPDGKDDFLERIIRQLQHIFLGEKILFDVLMLSSGEIMIPANRKITTTLLRKVTTVYDRGDMAPSPMRETIKEIISNLRQQAVAWLGKAAEQDHFDAILKLAQVNDGRPAFEPNFEEAFKWYKIAADRGSPLAQYCVGSLYLEGRGVPKDDVEAARWFHKAAIQRPPGFSVAQHALGLCYRKGIGVPQSYENAVGWFYKASELGLATAQTELGDSYRLGRGVQTDLAAAAKWYEKAAEQGDAVAQNNLGICYKQGMGVPKNMLRAFAWLRLAGDSGVESARQEIGSLRNLMSAADLEAAQRLFYEFRKTFQVKG